MRSSFNDIALDFDDLFTDVEKLTHLEGESLNAIFGPLNIRTVLDCACGTGIQSIGLARLGYDVAASDISSRMVDRVREKSIQEKLVVETRCADFRNLKAWEGRVFDAVVCSGNSITLMKSSKDIQKTLASMVRCTKRSGGVGVVGMHNYLVLRDLGQTTLIRRAEIEEDSARLQVDLRFFGEERAEVTYLFVNKTKRRWHLKTYTKSYWMLPVDELRRRMIEAGYRSVRLLDVAGQHEYNNDEWVLAVGLT